MEKSMLKLLSIADLISISNAIFGFFSILVLLTNLADINIFDLRLNVSLALILCAIVLDGLDGFIARKTWNSEIGEFLDSMADMTSLVVAPSIFIYFVYSSDISCCFYKQFYILIALVILVSFGIVRLASFHLYKKEKLFVGLPAPAGTIILLLLTYIKVDLFLILPAIIIIGALMASSIIYPKPSLKINIVAFILIVLIIIFTKNYYMIAPTLLLIAISIYIVFSPIYVKFYSKKQ